MTIRIQPGMQKPPVAGADIPATERTPEGAATDPVSAVAADLAAGNITASQAVDRLIAHTMNSEMVAQAPASLRAEVEEALRAAIETDPYLRSLQAGLD